MKRIMRLLKSDSGSALVYALLSLSLLIIAGVSAIRTGNTDVEISTNHHFHTIAFYTAETATSFVAGNPSLYHIDNITLNQGLTFPDVADATARQQLNTNQSFNGNVVYIGSGATPRGSGYSAGQFRSHRYRITATGFGPRDSESNLEAGFYRIGF